MKEGQREEKGEERAKQWPLYCSEITKGYKGDRQHTPMVEDVSEIKSGKGLGSRGGSLAKRKGSAPRRPSRQAQSTETTSKNKRQSSVLSNAAFPCNQIWASQ